MFWEVPATPLHAAAWRGEVAAIRQLVTDCADVNASDDMGGTALYWMARGGHPIGPHQCQGEAANRPEVIATLIELGANPNTQDRRPKGFGRSSGWTPLLVALHHQQFKSAAVLLEKGADPNIRSDQGMSAMDMATVEGAPTELMELMRAKGFKAQAAISTLPESAADRWEVPLRVRFPDLRGAQAAMVRSSSEPITQSFGCSSTRVTNAFSVRARFENSAAVYTVGLIFRPTACVTRSRAPKTSPYLRLSLMIIRSMSLADWSVALATEPYTKAARIAADKGFKASRSGSARPTVFNTILRSSE